MARTSALARRRFELMAAEYLERMGARIAARREALGLTQDELARQMPGRVTGTRISLWERGKNRPRDDSLEALAGILDVPVSYLLASDPDKAETPDPFAGGDSDLLARLDEIADAIAETRTERDEQAQRVEQVLQGVEQVLQGVEQQLGEQSDVLDMIRTVVAGLGVPQGVTLEDHLARIVRDLALRTYRPPPEQ